MSFSALQRAENSSIVPGSGVVPNWNSFSALQRAENSSMFDGWGVVRVAGKFQCSSASRKFLNRDKSNQWVEGLLVFQCSSASRKFLNRDARSVPAALRGAGFSALQRAENSSIYVPDSASGDLYICFSALQRAENSSISSG